MTHRDKGARIYSLKDGYLGDDDKFPWPHDIVAVAKHNTPEASVYVAVNRVGSSIKARLNLQKLVYFPLPLQLPHICNIFYGRNVESALEGAGDVPDLLKVEINTILAGYPLLPVLTYQPTLSLLLRAVEAGLSVEEKFRHSELNNTHDIIYLYIRTIRIVTTCINANLDTVRTAQSNYLEQIKNVFQALDTKLSNNREFKDYHDALLAWFNAQEGEYVDLMEFSFPNEDRILEEFAKFVLSSQYFYIRNQENLIYGLLEESRRPNLPLYCYVSSALPDDEIVSDSEFYDWACQNFEPKLMQMQANFIRSRINMMLACQTKPSLRDPMRAVPPTNLWSVGKKLTPISVSAHVIKVMMLLHIFDKTPKAESKDNM